MISGFRLEASLGRDLAYALSCLCLESVLRGDDRLARQAQHGH